MCLLFPQCFFQSYHWSPSIFMDSVRFTCYKTMPWLCTVLICWTLLRFVSGARTILEDDRVLESIEASFRQFHGFLDLLKGSRWEELVLFQLHFVILSSISLFAQRKERLSMRSWISDLSLQFHIFLTDKKVRLNKRNQEFYFNCKHGLKLSFPLSRFSDLAQILGENSRLPEPPERGLSPITEEPTRGAARWQKAFVK